MTGPKRRRTAARVCALGVMTALLMTAPSAVADPVEPPPSPPVSDTASLAVSGDPAIPPAGVPHLMSPDNLPPGTTTDAAVGRAQTPRLFRLRELWDAIHTDGMSLSEALPLLAQRPLDANPVPPPEVSAGPQSPPPTEPLPPTP
ncbi:MAG: dopamine receptor D4 [Candidatus Sericytochromatia bacterium]